MDLKKRRWVFALGAIGFAVYGVYRVLNSSFVVKNKQRMITLIGASDSLVKAVSDSSEAIAILSKDTKDFLLSDSDQVPRSLKQLCKITSSGEFHESIAGITTAITAGVNRALGSESASGSKTGPGFGDRVIDRLFSEQGSGFASLIAGSFSRNLATALYSEWCRGRSEPSVPKWVQIVWEDNCRELIGDVVRAVVTTAVTVYLDKTKHINAFDDLFSGITNPRHEAKVRHLLVSLCSAAVETHIKASNSLPKAARNLSFGDNSRGLERPDMIAKVKLRGLNRMLASAFAIPTNRKLALDMAGAATSETVRSFLEVMKENLKVRVEDAGRKMGDKRGEALRYTAAKTASMGSLCLALCLYVLESPWSFAPR